MTDPQKELGRGSPPPTPQWVKWIALVAILVVLLVVILHLMGFGFGGHGISSV